MGIRCRAAPRRRHASCSLVGSVESPRPANKIVYRAVDLAESGSTHSTRLGMWELAVWNIGPMEMLILFVIGLIIVTLFLAPVVAIGVLAWFLYRSYQKNRIDSDPRGD